MANTFQCMKLCVYGRKFKVIQHFNDINPFWLYEITDKGTHLLVKYCNFESVLWHLLDMRIPEFFIDYNPKL